MYIVRRSDFMKKNLFRRVGAVLMLTMCTGLLAGCSKKVAAKTDINIAVMTGPTAIGLVKVMDDNENGSAANNYNFQVYGEATEISTGLVKGELDVACVPCNLASVLYNKTDGTHARLHGTTT